MRPSKIHFVTACQQLLALATVLAVMAPATNVVSLDVVITRPGTSFTIAERPALGESDPTKPAPAKPLPTARVETEPVEPEVTEVPMKGKPAARDAGAGREGVAEPDDAQPDDGTEGDKMVSDPEPVHGYGAVGVTWSHENEIADDEIEVSVRTRTGDTWSAWEEVEYHDEHQPDPGSPEGRDTRPGTDPLIIGDVDEVQARAITEKGAQPVDMKLAVIAPGTGEDQVVEPGDIELPDGTDQEATEPAGDGEIELQAAETDPVEEEAEEGLDLAATAPRPAIYSRRQWGANESLRSGSPRYGTISAGFVHHTVNSNSYSSGQVPGIIRSIYAYHTRSRGWSDIGYNFLVDRFGRIWEGRYGGVTRPVIGAHTRGYNQYSFAMSAIGNFEQVKPTSAVLAAYGKLMGWKLSLHGVNAQDTSQKLGSRYFRAINGHRDAGSTACPGRYLYARLPDIRTLARQAQLSDSPPPPAPKPADRRRVTDLTFTSHPDILLRRASDGAGFVLPTQGTFGLDPQIPQQGYGDYNLVLASPDLTGDGRVDLVVRRARDGRTGIRPGNGAGRFEFLTRPDYLFRGMNAVAAPGDINGDGRADLVTRRSTTGRLWFYRGNGNGTFTKFRLNLGWKQYNLISAAGDLTGDGRPDLVTRDASGRLWIHPGAGRGRFGARLLAAGGANQYDEITGYGDWNLDGQDDLFARNRSTGKGYILPGQDNAKFGHRIGPVSGAAGLKYLSSGGNVAKSREPDLVGVRRNGNLNSVPHAGRHNTRGAVPTGLDFSGANLLLNAGDWDGDGKGDLITRNAGTGNVEVRRGAGRGRFGAPSTIASGWTRAALLAAVGDVTGDGKPDLMAQPGGWGLRYYVGNGLEPIEVTKPAGPELDRGADHLAIGLWNDDKVPDSMFRFGDHLTSYTGSGTGTLESPTNLGPNLSAYDWVVAPGDVDGDNHPDLVALEKRTGYLWLFRGNGKGFAARMFLAEGYGGYDLAG